MRMFAKSSWWVIKLLSDITIAYVVQMLIQISRINVGYFHGVPIKFSMVLIRFKEIFVKNVKNISTDHDWNIRIENGVVLEDIMSPIPVAWLIWSNVLYNIRTIYCIMSNTIIVLCLSEFSSWQVVLMLYRWYSVMVYTVHYY